MLKSTILALVIPVGIGIGVYGNSMFLITMSCCCIWFFLLEIYNLRLKQGEPLTVHQLKKKVLYTIHGRGKFIANNGQLEKKVLFVMDSSLLNPKIISVILPVELSEGTWRFYVIQDYDELGTQIEHQGAIVAFIDDDSNSQANYKKILFPWNSKQSKSQK